MKYSCLQSLQIAYNYYDLCFLRFPFWECQHWTIWHHWHQFWHQRESIKRHGNARICQSASLTPIRYARFCTGNARICRLCFRSQHWKTSLFLSVCLLIVFQHCLDIFRCFFERDISRDIVADLIVSDMDLFLLIRLNKQKQFVMNMWNPLFNWLAVIIST